LVPHTRDPMLFCSVSDAQMKPRFESYGMKFSDYEGPASIITFLTTRAKEQDVEMASIVASVPAYVQGANPKCIVATTRRIAGIFGIRVDLDDLQASADEFEKKLTEVVQEQPELAENIVKLEQDYDNEIFSEMGDLKNWLHQKGIRLD
jgi:proteasome assembly chaperone (PAC2) family protein